MKNNELLECVKSMPPRKHWPVKTTRFKIEQSEVAQWLLDQPKIREWILKQPHVLTWVTKRMTCRKLIKFSPETGNWHGSQWKPKTITETPTQK